MGCTAAALHSVRSFQPEVLSSWRINNALVGTANGALWSPQMPQASVECNIEQQLPD